MGKVFVFGSDIFTTEVKRKMPSQKVLLEKQAQVAKLVEKLKGAKSVVLVDYKGMNVDTDTKLRSDLRKEGVEYSVVKNTLLNLACKQAGMEDFAAVLSGTTAIAVSEDEVAPARIIDKYVTKSKELFKFKMGYVSGKFVSPTELKAIAALPSREGLIGQVAGTLNGIVASLARAVNEVANKQSA